jgi:polar amino acid transport system substrate-binding protein
MRQHRPHRTVRRGLGVVLAVVLGGAVLAACGDDGGGGADGDASLLDELQDRGSITVGFADEIPYGYLDDDGEPTGEAPEVARAVLAELGIDEVEGVVVEFGSLIPGLNAGRFDMIAAGMFITAERAEQILFSDPDYCGTTAFGVEAGNPLGLESFDDVAADPDVRLGVLGGAVEEDYALGSGVPEDQIQSFPSTAALFDGLTAGRIDAAALTTPTVVTQIEAIGSEDYEATDGFVPVVDGVEQLGCGGFGFREEDEELRDAFNEVLVELREDDGILPIIEPFGFTESDTEAAKGLTVEDLIAAEEEQAEATDDAVDEVEDGEEPEVDPDVADDVTDDEDGG